MSRRTATTLGILGAFVLAIAIANLVGSDRAFLKIRCSVWHAMSGGVLAAGNAQLQLPGAWCPIGDDGDRGTAIAMVPPSRGAETLVVFAGAVSPDFAPDSLAFPEQMVWRGVETQRDGQPTPIEVDGHRGYRASYTSSDSSAGQRSVQVIWTLPSADFGLVASGVPAARVHDIESLANGLSVPSGSQPAEQ